VGTVLGLADAELAGQELDLVARAEEAGIDQLVVLDPRPPVRADDRLAHGTRLATAMRAVGAATGVTYSPEARLWKER
jgi:hypothetical protein